MDDLSSDKSPNTPRIRYLSPQANEMIPEPAVRGWGGYPLRDIIGGTSDATDFDEDVVIC